MDYSVKNHLHPYVYQDVKNRIRKQHRLAAPQ